jgi:NAD(P)-dependent dehydrogenase (short-subunit alcohol dehydrogenase family)
MNDYYDLKDKNFLVTGASSGIGRAVALTLAALGANVAITGRNNSRLENVASKIKKLSSKEVTKVSSSFDSIESVTELVKNISSELGPLDGCFHSAGEEVFKPIKLITQEDYDKVFSPVIYGAFGISKAFSLSGISAKSSSIVFMSSVSVQSGKPGLTLYASAKSALSGLIRSLACELAVNQIRVNNICSGGVKTEMHDRVMRFSHPETLRKYQDEHLLGLGEVDDIVNMAIFLLSSKSRWITGTDIIVDGGYLSMKN